MKNSTILLSAMALLMTFASCKKIKEATQRDIEITPTAITFTIAPIASTADGTTIGTQNVSLDLNALIKAQASEFGEDNIKKVKLKEVKLELLNSTTANNIANFEKLNLTLKTGSGSPLTVAAAANIPDTQSATLIVPISGDSELSNYLKASSFDYTLSGKLRRATTADLQVKLTAKYEMTVGL